eukprot:GHVU01021304.1.p1 GENE.GHVU01021304.1~~GHVU01021304.1.p1  ORF type:complete len:111 (-),score=5.54 GHVU01021304.1:637-969(-)
MHACMQAGNSQRSFQTAARETLIEADIPVASVCPAAEALHKRLTKSATRWANNIRERLKLRERQSNHDWLLAMQWRVYTSRRGLALAGCWVTVGDSPRVNLIAVPVPQFN